MEYFKDGMRGEEVRAVIEKNFNELSSRSANSILELSTEKKMSLPSNRLFDGLIVYDTTLKEWQEYVEGEWCKLNFNQSYTHEFSEEDWDESGRIKIYFEEHLIKEPTVYGYIWKSRFWDSIDIEYSITKPYGDVWIYSDLPFKGKVVIK